MILLPVLRGDGGYGGRGGDGGRVVAHVLACRAVDHWLSNHWLFKNFEFLGNQDQIVENTT